MRSSDGSSDVCSSDLEPLALSEGAEFGLAGRAACVRVCVHRLSSCLFAAIAPRMPGRGAWCQPIACVARSIMFRLRCDDGGIFPLTASAPHEELLNHQAKKSEERRLGKECVRTFNCRGRQIHKK